MRMLFWLAVAAFGATLVWIVWYVRRKAAERRLAEKARAAAFMVDFAGAQKAPAQIPSAAAAPLAATPSAPIPGANTGDLAVQKLLFEAAHKAGEAGEPALAIQLYARLLSRFPAATLASAAREAVEAQKKKLAGER